MTVRLEACGKVFLAGEYAVLDPGRPALVVGIDRKLHATADPSPVQGLVVKPGPGRGGYGGRQTAGR